MKFDHVNNIKQFKVSLHTHGDKMDMIVANVKHAANFFKIGFGNSIDMFK